MTGRNKTYAAQRLAWSQGRSDDISGYRSWSPSWMDQFERAYRLAGGWPGYATMIWVEPIAHQWRDLGIDAKSAGILLAHKQRMDATWQQVVMSGTDNPGCPTTTYAVDGVCKLANNQAHHA